jgi:hypothetical protein
LAARDGFKFRYGHRFSELRIVMLDPISFVLKGL